MGYTQNYHQTFNYTTGFLRKTKVVTANLQIWSVNLFYYNWYYSLSVLAFCVENTETRPNTKLFALFNSRNSKAHRIQTCSPFSIGAIQKLKLRVDETNRIYRKWSQKTHCSSFASRNFVRIPNSEKTNLHRIDVFLFS